MSSQQLEPTDRQPDWHGQKAKQKRQRAMRMVSFRSFVLGLLVAICLTGALLYGLLYSRDAIGTSAKAATLTAAQATLLASRTPLSAATPFAGGTALVLAMQIVVETPNGTLTPVPAMVTAPRVPNSAPVDGLFEYQYDTSDATLTDSRPHLTATRALPLKSLPGYQFVSTRFGPGGNLYIAHSQALGVTDCDPNEAYWIVDPQSGKMIDRLTTPSMISPKQIAFDSRHDAYVLAADCQQHVYAIFAFDAHGQWEDTFPISGGDDVIVAANDHIVVAVRNLADSYRPQPHLIELHRDVATGKLSQTAKLTSNRSTTGHYRSLIATETTEITFFAVWAEDSGLDQTEDVITVEYSTGQLAASAHNIGPIEGASGSIHVGNLASGQDGMFGLSLDGYGVKFDKVVEFPIPGVIANAFAIDPSTSHWFVTGQQIAVNFPSPS